MSKLVIRGLIGVSIGLVIGLAVYGIGRVLGSEGILLANLGSGVLAGLLTAYIEK